MTENLNILNLAKSRGYKWAFLVHKAIFDKGFGLTSYLKYIVAFVGIASRDVKSTLIMALLYGMFCYILGYFWVKNNWMSLENEVANHFNPFVSEVRNKLKVPGKNTKYK